MERKFTYRRVLGWGLLLIALGYGIPWLEYAGIRRNQSGLYHKMDEMFNDSTYYPLLFVGSSRAECHFNPCLFDSITSSHSFNIGMSGSNAAFTFGILKAWLYRHPAPKEIIYNLDFHFSHESSDTIFDFPRFFPYMSHPVLWEELVKRDKRFYLFRFAPYASLPYMKDRMLNVALRGYLNKPGPYDALSCRGNEKVNPLNQKDPDTISALPYKASLLQENKNYLDSVIYLCASKKIRLLFVISPTYYRGSQRLVNLKSHIETFYQLAEKARFPVVNYTDSMFCKNKLFFADLYHLSALGCDSFTLLFARDYQKIKAQIPQME